MPVERILIVDDDRDVRESMGEYLEGHGYQVTLAEGGEAMRKAFAVAVPDVVLLDLNLPGEDGLSLARWLPEVSHRLGGSHARRGLIGLALREAEKRSRKIGVRPPFSGNWGLTPISPLPAARAT